MDFVGAIKSGFTNYTNFRGTASRSEFWYWALFSLLASLVATTIERFIPFSNLSTLFSFATLLPSLAVSARRLRDAGYSWAWLLSLVPGFVLFVVGIVGITLAFLSSWPKNDPAVSNSQDFFQSAPFQNFIANESVIGFAILTFVGLILTGVFGLVVTIFQIMPSKTLEQGNKRIKPATPVI